MFNRILASGAALAGCSLAVGQGTASVDLLEPAETSGTIPANTRIVDIFFDITPTDLWFSAGIRAVTESGAAIIYFDSDANTPGIQPGLFNGGAANRFTTMLSRPRARDAARRFTDGGAASAGGYDPAGAISQASPDVLNVAYIASPPGTVDGPAPDGYIARIAVDISNVAAIPGADIADYDNWGAGPLDRIPSGARVVLQSIPRSWPGGTATTTLHVPTVDYTSWAMWYVPEPASLSLLALGGLAAIRRRHTFQARAMHENRR